MSENTYDEVIRRYARAGALLACQQAITEFPDLLAELNQMTAAKPQTESIFQPTEAPVTRKLKRKRQWSAAQRARFSATLRRKKREARG